MKKNLEHKSYHISIVIAVVCGRFCSRLRSFAVVFAVVCGRFCGHLRSFAVVFVVVCGYIQILMQLNRHTNLKRREDRKNSTSKYQTKAVL